MIDVVAGDLARLVPLLGWTLANFLWQGALIALVLQVTLRACRTARARHDLAVAALMLMALSPVATYAWLQANIRIVLAPIGTPDLAAGWTFTWEAVAVTGWVSGVIALAARTAGGLIMVERLRRTARPLPPEWAARCRTLHQRMAGSLVVLFAQSEACATPLVAGWLKPMVLIPAAALVRLPADQLEALILHELAHVRRFDVLANLVQTVVETALFYHPAVWWVSRRIRLEREHLCDDLAVDAVGDPALYVRALQAVDALRAPPFGVLAANGGDLKARAARVLGLAAAPAQPPLSRTAAILILTAAAAAMAHGVAVNAAEPRDTAQVAAAAPPRAAEPATAPPPIQREPRVVLVQAPSPLAAAPSPARRPPWNDPAMAARIAALGPMPPDRDPAAQAAWRVKLYDLNLETDRSHLAVDDESLARARVDFAKLTSRDLNQPDRLKALNIIDVTTRRRDLTAVHAEVVETARAAVLRAEALRLANAKRKAPVTEAAAARAHAVEAEAAIDTVANEQKASVEAANARTDDLERQIAKTTPGYPGYPTGLGPNPEVDNLQALEQRAHLEGLAYEAIREAVEGGKRPPIDLDTARLMLTSAQGAYWDARDALQARVAKMSPSCRRVIAGADGQKRLEPVPAESCVPPAPPAPPLPVLPARVVPSPLAPEPAGRDVFDILADFKAQGPMPSDADPVAQAAWRARRYDLQIEQSRAMRRSEATQASNSATMFAQRRAGDPEDPMRLRMLVTIDESLRREDAERLKERFEIAARDAFAEAEATRLKASAGRASSADAAAARTRALAAEHDLATVTRAGSEVLAASSRSALKYSAQLVKAVPEPEGSTLARLRANTARMTEIGHRAELETIAYRLVRDGVRAGERPASDLDAARDALKAAQEPLYDAMEDLLKDQVAQRSEDHKTILERLKVEESLVDDMEKRLPATAGAEHDRLEKRLATAKDMLALMRKASRNQLQTLGEFKRPTLPVLPPGE